MDNSTLFWVVFLVIVATSVFFYVPYFEQSVLEETSLSSGTNSGSFAIAPADPDDIPSLPGFPSN